MSYLEIWLEGMNSMSIKIDTKKCVGCGKCIKVCPGSLIYKNEYKKAFIKYPQNCWGCTACLKECRSQAIKYYLGADIGGNGAYLYVVEDGSELKWYMNSSDGRKMTVSTNRKESNKY